MAKLSPERELELIRLAQAGDNGAQAALLEQFQPMLHKLAKKVRHSTDEEDMLQNAAIAFLEAVQKFDPARGARLMTFCYWKIPHALSLDARRDLLVRAPSSYTANHSEAVARVYRGAASLDFRPDGDTSMAEFLEDDSDLFESVAGREHLALLDENIERLPERLRLIVRGRLAGKTLQEIGDELGITKTRVGQLEQRAHEILRRLLPYLPETGLPRIPYRKWARIEMDFLRDGYASRTRVDHLARELNRNYTSVVGKATSLGLYKQPRWTDDADAFLRKHRPQGWQWCAEKLDRSVISIYNRVRRLGIQQTQLKGPQWARVRELHAQGLTCGQIGLALGVTDECIRLNLHRNKLMLNKRDEQKRMASLARTLRERWGVDQIGKVRKKVSNLRARALGWGPLPLLAALVLESLLRIGRPADRDEIAAERKRISDEHGWHYSGGWHSVLTGTLWLKRHGMLTYKWSGNHRRQFWIAEGFSVERQQTA